MKKLFVVLLALMVIGSYVTAADVTIGTWSRLGFMLYQQAGSADATATAYPSWGRVGLSFSAKTDLFGMAADVNASPSSVGLGDTAKLYVKLFDKMVTISAGKGYFDTLRGKIGGAQSVGLCDGGGEDDIFARFSISKGLMTELSVSGLYVGAAFSENATTKASYTYRDIQVGAGYTIEGIGLVRAQFIGGYVDTRAVQAAFAFTGVQGLTVDAGAKFYLGGDETTNQNFASVAAKYSKDALGAMVRTKVLLPKDPKKLDMSFGANVNYKVMDGIVLGADFGLSSILETGKVFKATPYVQHNPAGGGTLQLGFQMQMGLDGAKTFTYGIPLVLTF
jgi:hypothetical protein